MTFLKNYILARLRERSTWIGLAVLVSGVTGIAVPDATIQAVALVGAALAGSIGASIPD